MKSRDFEAAITVGKAHWITSFHYDTAARKFVIGLTWHPESPVTERIVEFNPVKAINFEWIDRDDECLEGLLGASEFADKTGIRYLLNTEQRKIDRQRSFANWEIPILDGFNSYLLTPKQ